jgi:hypothetical protein
VLLHFRRKNGWNFCLELPTPETMIFEILSSHCKATGSHFRTNKSQQFLTPVQPNQVVFCLLPCRLMPGAISVSVLTARR